mgnify:CR=1 FL=1
MKSQDIVYLKKKNRIKIGALDLFLSYLSLFFMIGIPWFTFSSLTIHSFYKGRVPELWFILVAIILTIIVGRIFYSIPRKLRLTKVGEYQNENQLKLITTCFKELRWSYSMLSENEYVASTRISWFSWGEHIYLVFYDNSIFMNSIGKTSPITFGKDFKNLENFKTLFDKQRNILIN